MSPAPQSNRHDPSMRHINGHNQLTVNSYNWHPSMGHPNSEKLGFTLFNHVLDLSSTMHVLSMQQCSQLSMKSVVHKPRPHKKTKNACTMLLDYAATYPLAIIRYYASDMALNVDTDAAYLVLPNAQSCYAGTIS